MLSDDNPIIEAGISDNVVKEITKRTPDCNSRQEEEWQAHFNSACEFHGDAPKEELYNIGGDVLSEFLDSQIIKPNVWENILAHYQSVGNPALY